MCVMGLSEITSESVLRAIEDYDRRGAENFRSFYGFGPTKRLVLARNGRIYDSRPSPELENDIRRFRIRAQIAHRTSIHWGCRGALSPCGPRNWCGYTSGDIGPCSTQTWSSGV